MGAFENELRENETFDSLMELYRNEIHENERLKRDRDALKDSIRETCGHDGSCDHCGAIPSLQVPFQLCDECRAALTPSASPQPAEEGKEA